MSVRLLTVAEAIEYQKKNFGHVVHGRDALYAIARVGQVPVVRSGRRRVYYPASSIDLLLSGMVKIVDSK